ncbi:integrase core domain-containing protein, partial [Parabacteroides distasonis]
VQYCSKDYISILQGIKCRISMTENGDPRENAIAERVNGILKEEWLNKEMITTLGQARDIVRKVIDIYNTRRPHSSVEMLTPEEAHAKKGPLKRKWKTIYKRKQAILL